MSKQSRSAKNASRPLKVGFVFDDSLDSFDGVSQYVKLLGKWFSENDHQVRYLVGQTRLKEWSGGKVYSLSRNKKVSFNGNVLSTPLPADRKKIREVLDSENFDILHVQVPFSPFMAQRVIESAGPSTAVVGTFHILPANRTAAMGSRALAILQRKILRRFDEVVGVSSQAAAYAGKIFGVPAQVLPNVVDVAKYKAGYGGSKRGSGKVVFLGRLVKRKGAMQLLLAAKKLHQDNYLVAVTIAGSGGEKAALELFVKSNGLENHVKFTGFVSEEDKPALLAGADIACFPALYGESFGIVLIEAMAAGSGVVIGGDNPGYRTVLGGRPELLVDPRDTDQLASRIKQFLQDKKRFHEAHAWLSNEVKRYDINRVGPEVLKLYELAIAKRAKKNHNKAHED